VKLPLISVIVPVYNTAEEYLRQCFDSCANQTYFNLEIIIVDDGSKPTTAKFCDNYARKDKRVQVIHKQNDGLNNARRTGFEASAGNYVTFVDSDDIIDLEFIEKLYWSIEDNKADIAVSEYVEFTDVDNIKTIPNAHNLPLSAETDKKRLLEYIVRGAYPSMRGYSAVVWCKLYRASLLRQIDWDASNYRINEDEFFSPQTHLLADRVSFVNEQLYHYRRGLEDSLSVLVKDNEHNGVKVSYLAFAYELYQYCVNLSGQHNIEMNEWLIERYYNMLCNRVRELMQISQFLPSCQEELLRQYSNLRDEISTTMYSDSYKLMCCKPNTQVSIIVPIYNTDVKYMKDCFDSVKRQTYWSVEVLLVDDGSNKKTVDFCKKYIANLLNWSVISQKNGGPSIARNRGLRIAQGEYIQFVDSDDIINDDMIEKMVTEAEATKADIVVCRFKSFDESPSRVIYHEPLVEISSKEASKLSEKILNISAPSVCVKMLNRKFISVNELQFDESLARGEDLLFTSQALTMSNKISMLNEYLYNYRVSNSSSIIHSDNIENLTTLDALEKIKAFLIKEKIYEKFKDSFIRRVFDTILYDYVGRHEAFIVKYSEIREFLLGLDEYIANRPRSFFKGAYSGWASYDDVMRIIKFSQPIYYYIDKNESQAKQIIKQNDDLATEKQHAANLYEALQSSIASNKDIKSAELGIKSSTKQLARAIKKRMISSR